MCTTSKQKKYWNNLGCKCLLFVLWILEDRIKLNLMKSWDSPYQCVSVVNKEKIIWTPGLLNIILLHFVICFVASSCLFLSTSIAEGCHDIDQLPYMTEDGCFYMIFVCKLTTNLFFSDLSHWQLKVLWKRIFYFFFISPPK